MPELRRSSRKRTQAQVTFQYTEPVKTLSNKPKKLKVPIPEYKTELTSKEEKLQHDLSGDEMSTFTFSSKPDKLFETEENSVDVAYV